MSKAFPFHHGLTATGYVQSPTTDAQLPATTVSASFTSQQYLEKSLPNWTLHMKCLWGAELSYSGPGHVLCINAESLPQEIMSPSLVSHMEF